MSQKNVEVVRGIYERFSEGDFRASVDLLDPHIVFTLMTNAPDADVHVAVEAVAEATRDLLETWADYKLKAEEFIRKVIRIENFPERAEALEAAGLSE
jgi:ketosteroid isomerase-like protein